jgi:hypothetical protein
MSLLLLRLLVLGEVGLILFLVLRLRMVRQPSAMLRVLALLCVLLGAILLYRSYLEYGWLGPFGFLRYIPARIRFIKVTLGEAVNYWAFLDPLLCGGIFAVCLLVGGAGLLRMRAWARRLLLWSSSVLGVISAAHVLSGMWRMRANEFVPEFILFVFAASCFACLCLPGCSGQFVTHASSPGGGADGPRD